MIKFKDFLHENSITTKIKSDMVTLQKEFNKAAVFQPVNANKFGLQGISAIFISQELAHKYEDKLAQKLIDLGYSPDYKKATKSSSTVITSNGKEISVKFEMVGLLKSIAENLNETTYKKG